jgi:aminoglycoside phosphotransferase (APT) family kinase protein
MTNGKSNLTIDVPLVERLVAEQFPQWAHLPISLVEPGGWDNRTFHLGEEMSVRLPSAEGYVPQVEKEHRWLPRLAPHLPLPIPVPLALGHATDEYPWAWSIYRWLDGEIAAIERIADLQAFTSTLARFLVALQRVDASGGPPPGAHNFWRGGSLGVYDGETRRALAALDGQIDTATALEVWENALATSWDRAPVWFHGDIATGNLLVECGRLSAVIDFGTAGVGDPACDLAIAWTLFSGESREAFRAALALDDATWGRGRAWTLWKALIVAAGIAHTNAHEATKSRHIVDEVLDDHMRDRRGGNVHMSEGRHAADPQAHAEHPGR